MCWLFYRFPKDKPRHLERREEDGKELMDELKSLMTEEKWTANDQDRVTELMLCLVDHWDSPPRSRMSLTKADMRGTDLIPHQEWHTVPWTVSRQLS